MIKHTAPLVRLVNKLAGMRLKFGIDRPRCARDDVVFYVATGKV